MGTTVADVTDTDEMPLHTRIATDTLHGRSAVGLPRVSPDGTHVACVVSTIDLDENVTRTQVWLDGTPVTAGPYDSQPAWSPDGRWLAFTSRRGEKKGDSTLHVLPVDGPGELRTLCVMPDGLDNLAWSPDGRWLAEGLASYYQNVLRARVGLLGQDEAWRLLEAGFARGRDEHSGLPLSELSRRHRGTMRVYWAGAAYWLEADLALRRDHRSSLDAVLARYASCCLHGTGEVAPERFAAELDRISGSEVFTGLFRRYVDSTVFPSLDSAYAELGNAAGADGVRFSDRTDALRLRRAVMGPRPVR